MREGDTIEVVAKGALHPGMRGAITQVHDDGSVEARFQAGKYKIDEGEFAVIDRNENDTVEIVKGGSLPEGARGVIEEVYEDDRVKARFEEGTFKVDPGDYIVVS